MRKAFIVIVDLDEVPGLFHTVQMVNEGLQSILLDRIGHYNPVVFPANDDVLTRETPELPVADTPTPAQLAEECNGCGNDTDLCGCPTEAQLAEAEYYEEKNGEMHSDINVTHPMVPDLIETDNWRDSIQDSWTDS